MATTTPAEDWQTTARLRITDRWDASDALGLWAILRNPDNTISRQQIRTLDPTAPPVRASIAAWRTFLTARFPALPALLGTRQAAQAADTAQREAAFRAQRLTATAEQGPAWQYQGTVYPHALAFVTHLLTEGFVPEQNRIGTVRFVHPSGRFLGPYRNKHLNAALAVLTPTPAQKD